MICKDLDEKYIGCAEAWAMVGNVAVTTMARQTVVWTIAGFDPSSGAGVTADLMTFAAHGLFGCAAPTAMTVQTTVGVFGVEAVAPELLWTTLERLEEDLPAAGIKVGMLGTPELAAVVAEFLRRKEKPLVVLDPVLRSSSGRELYPDEGLEVLRGELLPLVDWVTPNWEELGVLAGSVVGDLVEAEEAARRLQERCPGLGVVVTGGDQAAPLELVVQPGKSAERVFGERVETRSTHGTGCAFSSALLARLAAGAEAVEAVRGAKAFVEGALRRAPGVGHGRGPMELLWPLRC